MNEPLDLEVMTEAQLRDEDAALRRMVKDGHATVADVRLLEQVSALLVLFVRFH